MTTMTFPQLTLRRTQTVRVLLAACFGVFLTLPASAQNPTLSMTVDNPTPEVGQFVTFTVEARRSGGNVNNVEVTDRLPSGLAYDSHTTSQGTYTPSTGLWDIGRVNGGGIRRLTLTAQVTAAGTFTNEADVTNPSGGDHAEVTVTAVAPPPLGSELCYLVADAGGANGGNDWLTRAWRDDGAETAIGTGTGTNNIEASAYWPGTHVLYAVNANRLGTLDFQGGGGFTAGPNTFGSGDGAAGSVTFGDVDGLAFDPLTGILYGTHRRGNDDLLFQIDPATGRAIPDAFGAGVDYVVVNTSATVSFDDIDDIGIDPYDGQLYGIANDGGTGDRLVKIDKATGVVTDVGPLAQNDVEGMTFDAFGTFYASTGTGGGANANAFFTIDKATGTATKIADLAAGSDYESVACLVDGVNTVAGTTFFDRDADGTYAGADAPEAGAPVYLWRDVDGDGTIDPTVDVRVAATATAADGSYGFTVAADGDFLVEYGSAPSDGSAAMTTPTHHAVSFADFGNDSTGHDFGTTTSADLALSMGVDDPSPNVGDPITFTLTLTNEGLVDATGIQVSNPVIARADTVEIVSTGPDAGTYADGMWDVGSLAPGETVTLAITVRLLIDNVAFTSLAEIATFQQTDVDSTPYNGDTAEDDYASATATTGGSSSGGEGGLESNGTMAETLARVLYGRRVTRATAVERGASLAPQALTSAAKSAERGAGLRALFPAEGPAESTPFEVSPTDLLPVTNARSVLAADYLRPADSRRMAVLFATATAPGEVYEHTKVVCDRLRGAMLEGIEHVEIGGHPFVMARLRYPNGSVDYAVSFVAYPTGTGYAVDSRFLLSDYAPEGNGDDVLNVQAWSVSRVYTVELVERVLSGLDGEIVYRNTSANAPALPSVFVRRAEYANGRLSVEINNGAGVERVQLSGGTLARVEGGERADFSAALDLPEVDGPVVTATFETGPVFDVAFFVETDAGAGADLLYLADGAWGYAVDPEGAAVDAFAVEPEAAFEAEAEMHRVERPARITGAVETWASLFRYLRAGGGTVDLSGFEWIEFTASGRGDVRMLVEKASIVTSDHYGADLTLTPEPTRHRIPLADLRRADGAAGFTGEDAVVLSFFVWGDGQAAESFALDVSDVVFGRGTEAESALPGEAGLAAAYPNPFSSTATISFELPEAQTVELSVYDMLGRRVAVLADGEYEAGRHTVRFDGRGLASGVYIYRLALPGRSLTRQMALVR